MVTTHKGRDYFRLLCLKLVISEAMAMAVSKSTISHTIMIFIIPIYITCCSLFNVDMESVPGFWMGSLRNHVNRPDPLLYIEGRGLGMILVCTTDLICFPFLLSSAFVVAVLESRDKGWIVKLLHNIFVCAVYVYVYTCLPSLIRYPGKPGCCLQPEIDGLRVISNDTSEFMHRVTSKLVSNYIQMMCIYLPEPSLSVLRIGSMEEGALLNDAFKEYEVCFTWY